MLIILRVSLWTLTILSRPMRAWKLLLLGAVAAAGVGCVAVPAISHSIFLLEVTPIGAVVAAVVGAGASVLVEFAHRLSTRREPAAPTAQMTGID
jgi:hypothetical protein